MDQNNSIKVYKYRWIILLILCFYSGINFMQLPQYTVIKNITVKYYNVNNTLVELTALLFMISYIILCLPCSYFIEKYNLKIVALTSSGLTTIGNLVKLFSIGRDNFYIIIIGQTFCAIAQVFILSIPSKLASTWFGPDEVSKACAIGVLGTQFGVAAGTFFSSEMVRNSENLNEIGDNFMNLHIINSSITVASFVAVLLFFRAKPALAPSQSQIMILQAEKLSILAIIKEIVKNKDYLLVIAAFGSCCGLYAAYELLYSELYLNYFPGYEVELGVISSTSVIVGACSSSFVFGYILDKWHHFKLTSLIVFILSAITYSLITVIFEERIQIATYFITPLYEFSIGGIFVLGYEFATEVTYPLPEAASCGILNCFYYLCSISYTLLFGFLFDSIGYTLTNVVGILLILMSAFIMYFVQPNLKRRKANFGG